VNQLRHLRLTGSFSPNADAEQCLLRLADALDADKLETFSLGLGMCNTDIVRSALTERFGDRVRFG
jgi:hypothetical protein